MTEPTEHLASLKFEPTNAMCQHVSSRLALGIGATTSSCLPTSEQEEDGALSVNAAVS
jgi:hypothetical protein